MEDATFGKREMMMTDNRKQLTLFLDQQEVADIEKVRTLFNHEQAALINCHITLCREDEIECIDQVIANIQGINNKTLTLEVGNPTLFNNGKGVYLPIIDNSSSYSVLRKMILSGIIAEPRIQEPHITLIHPSNGTCNDQIFLEIQQFIFPKMIHLKEIALIEQRNGGQWKVLRQF